ncbi:hypothetical protein BO82DRAFT_6031 [Aspergillus uvarum CBS 121591]|uniref:Uncharacterized protein n=1 Tax=Aspergillus uvarum CBS 121591 TaxID=1448315 RepID=A0A319CP85_9EURO|nr:hypothetical protein BO82DRAFT_6031 [Aspergillus uvarum CBS 121591]PYH87256.1 hypothetical protein BO82DRAFT_6031 [Aspergillus uvarum CBS 121591]
MRGCRYTFLEFSSARSGVPYNHSIKNPDLCRLSAPDSIRFDLSVPAALGLRGRGRGLGRPTLPSTERTVHTLHRLMSSRTPPDLPYGPSATKSQGITRHCGQGGPETTGGPCRTAAAAAPASVRLSSHPVIPDHGLTHNLKLSSQSNAFKPGKGVKLPEGGRPPPPPHPDKKPALLETRSTALESIDTTTSVFILSNLF